MMNKLKEPMLPKCQHCGKLLTTVSGYRSINDQKQIDIFNIVIPGEASVLIWDWYCEDCDEHTETLMLYRLK